MGRRVIWEVRQRNDAGTFSRELGYFTDDAMADQAIRACYNEAWKVLMDRNFVPTEWFTEATKTAAAQGGFDVWAVNDLNSLTPTFYKVQHDLWSQLPSSMNNFIFSMEGSDLPFDIHIVRVNEQP